MNTAILLALGALVAWDGVWYALGVAPVSPWTLKKWVATGNVRIIDVRTPTEFRWFHIEGAENHPELLSGSGQLAISDPHQPIVVVCMTGHRSPPVARGLNQRGVKGVYHLPLGMLGWWLSGGAVLTDDQPNGP